MEKMSAKFFAAIEGIKKQMKKDRESAEHNLAKATSGLYSTLTANLKAQDAANKALTEATRRAKLDAEAALKEAKEGFTSKVAGLHSTVKKLEKKHNSKIEKLTGVVAANAIKDANGRAELRKISAFNKNELKNAVRDATHKGEQRVLAIEKKMKNINSKTRDAMNQKITTEISKLTKSIHSQITELNLQTKEARAEMKKEILYAIKSEAELAKQNLKKMVAWSEGEFTKLNNALKAEEGKSEGERAALAAKMARDKEHATEQLDNAVAAQSKALLAMTQETNHEIKKTNKRLAAHADRMIKNAAKVKAEMKANTAAIVSSLEAARKSADESLAGAVTNLNQQIAKQSALEDARFSKTVKDLAAARKAAADDVSDARKEMTSGIAEAKALAKEAEQRVIGEIQDVSAMVISDKAAQLKQNRIVDEEMKRLLAFSDKTHTANKAARGVIRKIMDENKAAAA